MRVSTQAQKDEKTIEMQRDQIKTYALAHGFNIVQEFVDEAVSGATEISERDGLSNLLTYLKTSTIKDVLIYDQSRVARDVYIALSAEKIAERLDARFHYVQAPSTGEESLDALLRTVLMGFAQFERSVTTKRTRSGRVARAKLGFIVMGNGVPYGYDYIERKLVINPEEAEIVKQMFEIYNKPDNSITTVVQWLIENKIKTKQGKTFKGQANSVRRILRSELYVGNYYYNKTIRKKINNIYKSIPRPKEEWIHISVPSIIDKATFDIAQTKLDNNQKKSKRTLKNTYIFQGLLKCGICGRMYHARPTSYRKVNKNYYFYHCGSLTKTGIDNCTNRTISEKKLVDLVYAGYIKTDLLEPDFFSKGYEEITDVSRGVEQASLNRIDKLKAKLKKFNEREEQILELQLSSKYSSTLVESKLASLLLERVETETELEKEESNLLKIKKSSLANEELTKLMQEMAIEIINEFETNPSPDQIRRIVKSFISEIIIYPDKLVIDGKVEIPCETAKQSWWGELQSFHFPLQTTIPLKPTPTQLRNQAQFVEVGLV